MNNAPNIDTHFFRPKEMELSQNEIVDNQEERTCRSDAKNDSSDCDDDMMMPQNQNRSLFVQCNTDSDSSSSEDEL